MPRSASVTQVRRLHYWQMNPSSFGPWRKAARRIAIAFGDLLSRNPTTGIAACCARTASGHAAALPKTPRNSRRLMTAPRNSIVRFKRVL
jgi:hypothetical protein